MHFRYIFKWSFKFDLNGKKFSFCAFVFEHFGRAVVVRETNNCKENFIHFVKLSD